ncbi:hypothetical protein L228DRAFT_245092 [Xylona heveae TC161]|uniref:Tubulin-specific chaperone A n=1 Tax=Xylona heveae (strain CBS 132557 / TC161) TaxID=1328760 RepID=A0A165I0P1_XYLHT|nr:hypothetical protein L228DRAFT_245092 [Xylona heveae TC161]KZF24193.1 hypothetical protein L228DRAFT_245092 [Xylona heveae TC161]
MTSLLRPMHTIAPRPRLPRSIVAPTSSRIPFVRQFADNKGAADEAMEEIQELYFTAKDEFDIAVEETEKKTVYAADDRAAAREELTKLLETYNRILETSDPEVSAEVKRRAGQRIRELENGVEVMEQSAMED